MAGMFGSRQGATLSNDEFTERMKALLLADSGASEADILNFVMANGGRLPKPDEFSTAMKWRDRGYSPETQTQTPGEYFQTQNPNIAGEMTPYTPTYAEQIGRVFGEVVGSDTAGKGAEAFLGDWTPLGNLDGVVHGDTEIEQQLSMLPLPGPARKAVRAGMGALDEAVGGAIRHNGYVAPPPAPVSAAPRARGMFGGRGVRAYHGGRAFEGDFDLAQAGSGLGYAEEPAAWFTPDKFEANRYAWSVDKSGTYEGKAVYPAVIDDAGFDEIPPMAYDPEEFARIIAEARQANRPGVIFRSVKEDDRLSSPADQIAVFDLSRIHSGFRR